MLSLIFMSYLRMLNLRKLPPASCMSHHQYCLFLYKQKPLGIIPESADCSFRFSTLFIIFCPPCVYFAASFMRWKTLHTNLGKLEQGKCRIWISGTGEARGKTEHLSLLFEKNQLCTWLLLTTLRWAVIRQGHRTPIPAGVQMLRALGILTQAWTESRPFNAAIPKFQFTLLLAYWPDIMKYNLIITNAILLVILVKQINK